MKVELLRDWRDDAFHNPKCGPKPVPLRRALPYLQGSRGGYVHRVRSGVLHLRSPNFMKGKTSVSFMTWCGQLRYLSRDRLYAEPPEGQAVCATCEGKAVGAGCPSTVITAHREVKFAPRSRWHDRERSEA